MGTVKCSMVYFTYVFVCHLNLFRSEPCCNFFWICISATSTGDANVTLLHHNAFRNKANNTSHDIWNSLLQQLMFHMSWLCCQSASKVARWISNQINRILFARCLSYKSHLRGGVSLARDTLCHLWLKADGYRRATRQKNFVAQLFFVQKNFFLFLCVAPLPIWTWRTVPYSEIAV